MHIENVYVGMTVRISGTESCGVVEQIDLEEGSVLVIDEGTVENEDEGFTPGSWMFCSDIEKA